ncbi:MAG: hypothetical protein SO487_06905 [Alloprevotella sp.]|nr:hypothetical protein [Alloprevotella sp.]
MKKFFLLTLLAISSLNVNAEEPRRIYAFLVHDSNYHTAVIKETTTSNNTWFGFDWKGNALLDENGEKVRFNNFLPLIAYMQNRGWTFPDLEDQMRAMSEKVVGGTTMFLMYHEATEAEWLEWIERGKSKKK